MWDVGFHCFLSKNGLCPFSPTAGVPICGGVLALRQRWDKLGEWGRHLGRAFKGSWSVHFGLLLFLCWSACNVNTMAGVSAAVLDHEAAVRLDAKCWEGAALKEKGPGSLRTQWSHYPSPCCCLPDLASR